VTSVLVLRALGLGDFLTGLPALRALQRHFRRAEVLLAAPDELQSLAWLSEAVDGLVPAKPLEPVHFDSPDVAVNLHGKGPQSHEILLQTNPGRLIAFANQRVPQTDGLPEWRHQEHEVDRWCRLLGECGIAADPGRLWLNPPPVEAPDAAVGATLIHPGAASPARRWPAELWAHVARAELKAGRPVAISAGPGEEDLGRQVALLAGLDPDQVIARPLLEMAAAVAAARVVSCGDTGVAHLATALGTPSVVLFGQAPPDLWGPPKWHPHISLWSGLSDGLLSIRPEEVTAALDRLNACR
jgi:ADP-heptose:LPS heptosyltransferase